jgi:hypothetical protein
MQDNKAHSKISLNGIYKGFTIKKYLENLADEIDAITTQMEDGADDYKEQIIGAIYYNLKMYERDAEGTLRKLLKDMRKATK